MEDWKNFLSTIPIFSFLTDSELRAVQELFKEVIVGKGETVCRVGDEGDTFFVVLSGELEVRGGEKEERRTGTLRARDFFGEMALLQGGKRTATVLASRRTRMLSLDRPSFERYFLRNPRALEYFARVLCKRLASVTRGDVSTRETTVVSVTGRRELKGKSLVASSLACILEKLSGSDTLLIRVLPGNGTTQPVLAQLLTDDLGSVPEKIKRQLFSGDSGMSVLTIEARRNLSAEECVERATNLVTKLGSLFKFMIFDISPDLPGVVETIPRFSDVLVEVVDHPTPPAPADRRSQSMRTYQVINLLNPASTPIPISDCEPFVLPKVNGMCEEDMARCILEQPRAPLAIPLYRLSRKLMGCTVGLALGGGAAFGISHLGVLKVLEDNDIPIDMVAGCSQGSIISVGYAAGLGVDHMIRLARRLGKKRNFMLPVDLTLLGPGFLAGNRMTEIFTPHLEGKKTFEDLVMPCRTIATDVETGERVAIGSGDLAMAFRASSAVPMIFSPLKLGDRALVDGGVADPVPAEVVDQMGADLCIAVNVVPPLRKDIKTVVARAYQQINRFNPLSYIGSNRDLPSMFDIVMNSMQILQYELGNFKAISADVLINPDLSDFTWIEYYRSAELIERGIEAAEKTLPAIKKALAEKTRSFASDPVDLDEFEAA